MPQVDCSSTNGCSSINENAISDDACRESDTCLSYMDKTYEDAIVNTDLIAHEDAAVNTDILTYEDAISNTESHL